MKDIIITARRQKTELWMLVASFVVANLVNIMAIAEFDAPLSELYTSIFYVLIFTVVIYALTIVVRVIYHTLKILIKR